MVWDFRLKFGAWDFQFQAWDLGFEIKIESLG